MVYQVLNYIKPEFLYQLLNHMSVIYIHVDV